MNYRKLGKWGLKISEVSLGSWMTNVGSEEAVQIAEDTIHQAYELGVNFFDCADCYSGGEAEKFLGRVLKDYRRSSYVVSSKVFFNMGNRPNEGGLSRKHIFDQVNQSLQNLQMDYIDLYFCHRFDPETPLEETLQALSDLVEQGKILYYGVSEWTGAQISEALGIIEAKGLRPLSVIQPQYHMFDRYIEDEIMGICERHGIGIVPFSPLAQGLLTGKYRKNDVIPQDSRATLTYNQVSATLTEQNLDKVEALLKIAQELGISLSVLALAWILRRTCISGVITGASKPEQIKKNVEASGIHLSEDVLKRIDTILDYHPIVRKIG